MRLICSVLGPEHIIFDLHVKQAECIEKYGFYKFLKLPTYFSARMLYSYRYPFSSDPHHISRVLLTFLQMATLQYVLSLILTHFLK
jgi:hypothetical protein